jgi:hypothetical protein
MEKEENRKLENIKKALLLTLGPFPCPQPSQTPGRRPSVLPAWPMTVSARVFHLRVGPMWQKLLLERSLESSRFSCCLPPSSARATKSLARWSSAPRSAPGRTLLVYKTRSRPPFLDHRLIAFNKENRAPYPCDRHGSTAGAPARGSPAPTPLPNADVLLGSGPSPHLPWHSALAKPSPPAA